MSKFEAMAWPAFFDKFLLDDSDSFVIITISRRLMLLNNILLVVFPRLLFVINS